MLRTEMRPRIGPPMGAAAAFCRRAAGEVERLVSGARAYICDACITACVAVLENKWRLRPAELTPGHHR